MSHNHDDDDWAVDLLSRLLVFIFFGDRELRWPAFIVFAAGATLLAYHFWG